jgi:hypothetical protein
MFRFQTQTARDASGPFADPEVAARKIIELANAVEPNQDGRIRIERLNSPKPFELKETPAEYKARLERAGQRFQPTW